jgi:hypothetical protein
MKRPKIFPTRSDQIMSGEGQEEEEEEEASVNIYLTKWRLFESPSDDEKLDSMCESLSPFANPNIYLRLLATSPRSTASRKRFSSSESAAIS